MAFPNRPICTYLNSMFYFMSIYTDIPYANPKYRFS